MINPLPQSKLWQSTSGTPEAAHSEQFWRSLFYFNVYRIMVAGVIIMITWMVSDSVLGSYNPQFFFYATLTYLLFGAISMLLIRIHLPRFNWQIAIQICSDVLFISILVYFSGGIQRRRAPVFFLATCPCAAISFF